MTDDDAQPTFVETTAESHQCQDNESVLDDSYKVNCLYCDYADELADEEHRTAECAFLKQCDPTEQWNFLASEEICVKCLCSHPDTTCPAIDVCNRKDRQNCTIQHSNILKCGAVPFDQN